GGWRRGRVACCTLWRAECDSTAGPGPLHPVDREDRAGRVAGRALAANPDQAAPCRPLGEALEAADVGQAARAGPWTRALAVVGDGEGDRLRAAHPVGEDDVAMRIEPGGTPGAAVPGRGQGRPVVANGGD